MPARTAGSFRLRPTRGSTAVCWTLFEGSGPAEAAAHVARVLARTHLGSPGVSAARVRRLRVDALDAPLPVQTDGDPRGTTPLQVEVMPGALLALGAGRAER